MKRSMLFIPVLSLLVFVASAHAQGTYNRDDDHEDRRYVLVEKSGDAVMCRMYSSTTEVRERLKEIQNNNKRNARANKLVKSELKKLKSQLAPKERKVKGMKEGPDRDAIQREIETLKGEIGQKERDLKPITKYLPYKRFGSVESAQKYINEVTASAARAKAKAEKKREKEAEKEAAKDEK